MVRVFLSGAQVGRTPFETRIPVKNTRPNSTIYTNNLTNHLTKRNHMKHINMGRTFRGNGWPGLP